MQPAYAAGSATASAPVAYAPSAAYAWEPAPAHPFKGTKWSIGLIGLVSYIFVIHQGVAPIGEAAVLLAVLGMFAGGGVARFPLVVVIFGLYLVAGGIGAVEGFDPPTSVKAWLDYCKLGVIFLVAVNVIRTPAQLRTLILLWLAFFALYPMRGTLLNYAAGITTNGRVAWNFTFSNPNDLAALCMMPTVMAAGVFVSERRGFIKVGALLMFIGLLAIIFITQSRGAIVAIAVSILLMIIRQRPRPKTIAMYAVIAAIVVTVAPGKTWERLGGLTKAVGSEDMEGVDVEGSAAQRLAIWKVAREIIADYPVMGVGMGGYPSVHRLYARTRDLPQIARGGRDTHSTYLNAMAETGVVGLALLITIWVAALWRSGKAIKTIEKWSPPLAMQFAFFRFGFVGFLVASIWGSYERLAYMYLYVAILFLFGEIYVPLAERALAGGGAPSVPDAAPRRRVGR